MDLDLMRANGITLTEVVAAERGSNLDVGAQTVEINRVEYLIRSLGFIEGLEDLESAFIRLNSDVLVLCASLPG